jgi:hypothetical protein
MSQNVVYHHQNPKHMNNMLVPTKKKTVKVDKQLNLGPLVFNPKIGEEGDLLETNICLA